MDELLPPQPVNDGLPPPRPAGKVQSFNCPSCGGVIKLHAAGHSVSAVCAHCAAIVDVANAQHKIIAESRQKIRNTFLSIGARGELFGVQWEVIGYAEKNNGTAAYKWNEYLLYNPYHGFRFLIQSDGHWTFFKVIKRDIAISSLPDEVELDGTKYQIFERGVAVVQYVMGEFYWTVKKGERVSIADYIAPPLMLSVEKNDDEIIVSSGVYVEPDIMDAAFPHDGNMPYRIGVAANQPSPFQGRIRGIWAAFLAAFLAATAIQIVTSASSDDAPLYSVHSRIYSDASSDQALACDSGADASIACDKRGNYGKNRTFASPAFYMPKLGNMFVVSRVPVNNDWAELHFSLVNEEVGKTYNMTHAIAYYSGRDSEGYWSEGEQSLDGFFEAVPAGTYRMLVEADSGMFAKDGYLDFSLNIMRDVPAWGNYWITLLLLLLYPAYAGIRHMGFENKRWSESDYAPAIYRKGEG